MQPTTGHQVWSITARSCSQCAPPSLWPGFIPHVSIPEDQWNPAPPAPMSTASTAPRKVSPLGSLMPWGKSQILCSVFTTRGGQNPDNNSCRIPRTSWKISAMTPLLPLPPKLCDLGGGGVRRSLIPKGLSISIPFSCKVLKAPKTAPSSWWVLSKSFLPLFLLPGP